MRPINKRSAAILDKLTADLADPTRGEGVAHYVEQNGDLVSDPEMVFWRNGEGWHPVSITQGFLGIYREVLFFDGHVYPRRIDTRRYRDLASFAGTWMRNIAFQQDLADLQKIRGAEVVE